MFWSFVHTPMLVQDVSSIHRSCFSLIFIFILDYDYRLIDSTDCDKSRLRLHRKHIYIDISRTCDIASLHNIESIGLKTIFYFLYGNKRDHTLVMDLTSLYSDFVMDGREVLFHSTIMRGTYTVRFLFFTTRTPISLRTRCRLTAALAALRSWSYLVRWSWPEPPRTTSKFLFRTPLVAPL